MKKKVQIEFTAPYYTFGELSDCTAAIWIVCPGYGQLAELFIKKFERFEEKGHYGIVLQGLHKFYIDPKRVGASWMTSHDRETDISHQKEYFSKAYQSEFNHLDLSKYQLVLLGFSQGVSAIVRMIFQLKLPFDKLVLWAGGFPPEIPGADTSFLKKDYEVIVAIGNNDKYYNADNYGVNIEYLNKTFGKEFEANFYPGDHSLDPGLLEKLINL